MRREHDSIAVEVLDALARYAAEAQGRFHITVLASRANLPHDRLRSYLDELASLGLVDHQRTPALTAKGRQFLECYHAWVRVQKIYGLDPRAGRGQPVRVLAGRHAVAAIAPSAQPPEGAGESAQGSALREAHGAFSEAEATPRPPQGA